MRLPDSARAAIAKVLHVDVAHIVAANRDVALGSMARALDVHDALYEHAWAGTPGAADLSDVWWQWLEDAAWQRGVDLSSSERPPGDVVFARPGPRQVPGSGPPARPAPEVGVRAAPPEGSAAAVIADRLSGLGVDTT